ncbi:MAG: family 78 glycoside hydrolase catalytic domain, partial [Treponema sp.]|nr:family 78 glycoside hydrolase catalytic domain [Treponema sp.]
MIEAKSLKTEYLVNPLGISLAHAPRLSWMPEGAKKQNAWQVKASKKNTGTFFDSGKVISNETFCIPDIPLASRDHIEWSVTLWDEHDVQGPPVSTYFELGLNPADWQAKWINPELDSATAGEHNASYLQKNFTLNDTDRARLYITSHGIYHVYINGKETEAFLYAPGNSQIPARLPVQTYDVSHLLKQGENELIVILGNGWYRANMGSNMALPKPFGTDTALLLQLEIRGIPAVISDESWLASQNGPLGLNDLMRGETYDAAKEPISEWHPVSVANFATNNLIGTNSVPVTAHERFTARLFTTPKGETVLDFTQNFAGYVHFALEAKAGQRITLTHGETLDKDGNFTITNFCSPERQDCAQKIEYICKDGWNEYHALACYFGFRYVKVATDIAITGDEFTGVAVYSDMAQTGFFSCGNEDVNQLFKNAVWSMKSNFLDVPTDCPTREKNPYSGDLQIFSHTAMYLMDCYPVLRKWIAEQGAAQFEDGCVKSIVPNNQDRSLVDGGAGWCDSFEIIPYRMMVRHNDPSAAAENYDRIKRWMLFCLDRGKVTRDENLDIPEELRNYFVDQGMHWGEWLEPGSDARKSLMEIGQHGEPEIATAFLSYGCRLMAEMADRLGEKEDVQFFSDASDKAKEAYRFRFVKDGKIVSERQCRYVRPIAFNLLSETEKYEAATSLAELIRKNSGKLNTGFLSTSELCRVLTDYGQEETAYKLLLQEGSPGWLYSVKKGATTILEQWDGIDDQGNVAGSFNHYSYGSIVGWLFDRVCGIRVENGTITIHPYPNPVLG